jgi:hypothetical protein
VLKISAPPDPKIRRTTKDRVNDRQLKFTGARELGSAWSISDSMGGPASHFPVDSDSDFHVVP